MSSRSSDDASDDEWRFSVEDVSGDAGDDEERDESSIFGPRPDEGVLEVVPGDPTLENALFVALGATTSLLLLLALIGVV